MATRTREQRWRASLRVYAEAGDYTVWTTGILARNRDRMFYVYPGSVSAEQIQSRQARPIFTARSYRSLMEMWRNPASWVPGPNLLGARLSVGR